MRCAECGGQSAEVTDCCPRCGASLDWPPSAPSAPEAAAPADEVETAPAEVGGAGELPARVRGAQRHLMLSLAPSLLLYMMGVIVVNATPQHSALHSTAGAGIWIGLCGVFVSVCLVVCAPQFRARQLGWAAIPIVSVGLLTFVPFAWVAIVRRRARDWAVFAVYLAAVAAYAVTFVDSNGSAAAYKSASVMLAGLLVIGSVHALLALSPAAVPVDNGAETMPPLPVRVQAISSRLAYAGSGLALLAGIVGFIAEVIFSVDNSAQGFSSIPVVYVVIMAVAIAALCGINRLVVLGLLQGMCWPAVAYAAADVAGIHADIESSYPGGSLAPYWIGVASDALGAAAAILLVLSWIPAVEWRRASSRPPLSVMLRWSVGLGQIGAWAFLTAELTTNAVAWTLSIALLLTGSVVTWYALNLRASALGGVLVLGWATSIALTFLPWTNSLTVARGCGCVLLVAVMILAVSYTRGPSDTDPSLLPAIRRSDEAPRAIRANDASRRSG